MITMQIQDAGSLSTQDLAVLRAIVASYDAVSKNGRAGDPVPLDLRDGNGGTAKLDPADNPAAGAPTIKDVPLFGGTMTAAPGTFQAPSAADVFSGGAVAIPGSGVTISDGGVTIRSNDSTQGAVILGNVQNQTPIPPPLPLLNLPISEPPLADATTGLPPPPPPPAPVPVNVSVDAPITSNVPIDADKLPWDARIHASTKTQNADGRWKKKRGVDAAEVTAVEAQLRNVMSIPAGTVAPPPPAEANGVDNFGSLMLFITPRLTAGSLTQAQVTAACQACGLDSINLLMSRPDLVPHVLGALQRVAA